MADYPRPLVVTNGCFDLLHAGHVDNLTRARALGQFLIVLVNSDESVRELKGPTRPITPLQQRLAMLRALRCVDLAIPFDGPTPEQQIRDLRPDVLVKGDEYTDKPIAGADFVRRRGGQVVTFPSRYPTLSTTDIINRIRSMQP